MLLLNTPISSLPRTSSLTIKRFRSLGINTYFDLLNYFPFRFENYSFIKPIAQVQPGETTTIIGKVIEAKFQMTKTGLKLQVFKINDESGEIEVGFFNQPYLLRLIKKGMTLSVSGEVEQYGKKLSLKPKEYEIGESKIHTGRIIPIYSEKKGLSTKTIREKIFKLRHDRSIAYVNEILPDEIITFNQLIDEDLAYQNIHFPKNYSLLDQAKKRLSFDELFTIQLAANEIKKEWHKDKSGNPFIIDDKINSRLENFIENLPFTLTNAQNKCLNEILEDMKKNKPMNRLLQGDVGSGKTVIAAAAAYLAKLNGFQTLFMAPTEILAKQHYETITKLISKSEIPNPKLQTNSNIQNSNNQNNIKISLITGSLKISNFKFQISNSDLIIGTQALLNKKFNLKRIGLVIVDEQHRFGVRQRASLKEKGINPHLLSMTATPIPRTVALTLYGELDISYLNEMPKGRIPIKSYLVPKHKRLSGYDWLKKQINTNKIQAFIICPLIEESKIETMKSVRAVKKEYEYLSQKIFTQNTVGLIHGRMKPAEKSKVMENFKNKKIDILISTSVVEVGIDIPNATVIIIEGAERYGLAQLHQLRGRVGRSNMQSYCFVFTENENQEIKKRLDYFTKHNLGNELAQYDLENRGSGEIFGTAQHGVNDLKIASLSDLGLIEKAKNAVKYFQTKYKIEDFWNLKERLNQYQMTQIAKD